MKYLVAALVATFALAMIVPQPASAAYRNCSTCHSQCPCSAGCTYYLNGPVPFSDGTSDQNKQFLGSFPVHTTCGAYTAQNGGSCMQGMATEEDLSLEQKAEEGTKEELEMISVIPALQDSH
ncbi:MAG: hypothetical protein K0U98_00270 [Deltaproteobacteria bacterium]|nr:hypothetical protein [Deltaproteobacteria bacterium]